MTRPNVVDAIVEALRNADATDETIAVVLGAAGAFQSAPRSPRRKHESGAARQKAYRDRKKRYVTGDESRDETRECYITPDSPRYVTREETHPIEHLRRRLLDVARGHFDPDADIAPIRALLDQGCDLEADVLPIVARDVTTLPRPLKNWGAAWLVRDILAARDQRLGGQPVEAPPPARRAPAIGWDE